jgi:hypothetical protein
MPTFAYGTWNTQTVDQSGFVGTVSIAVSSTGIPHLSYCESIITVTQGAYPYYGDEYNSTHYIKYANLVNSNWDIQTVDTGEQASECAIALDAAGKPHIAYSIADQYGRLNCLKYASLTGSIWGTQIVDQNVCSTISLVLASNGNPHIAYCDSVFGSLKYASWTGTKWDIATIDQTGGPSSLALDSNSLPQISYLDESGLKYARYTGSSWEVRSVDRNGTGTPSLVLDHQGNPHVSYGGKYASYTSAGWTIQEVGFSGSLALDSTETPHIAYITHAELKYASLTSSGWSSIVIDQTNADTFGSSSSISLALDSNGNTHVGYNTVSGYWAHGTDMINVKYAYVAGSPTETAMPSSPYVFVGNGIISEELLWNRQVVTSVDDIGNNDDYGSMTLDSSGHPHISYSTYDGTGGYYLKYATQTGPVWTNQTVDRYCWQNSIAVDSMGNPHIAYASSDGVQYASWTGSTWTYQIVDAQGGNQPCLKFDAAGNPHVLYADHNSYSLKYASWSGTTWKIQTIDSTVEWVEGDSLALDSAGNAHVCYGVASSGDLMYAVWNGLSWSGQKVDTGSSPSLVLDSQGNPHISYRSYGKNYFEYLLCYAVWTNSKWDIQTVDESSQLGGSSLCLDSQGSPRISYSVSGSLRFAAWVNSSWYLQMVDPYGCTFNYLALDQNGNPYICYHDAANRYVKYAYADISSIPPPTQTDTTNPTINPSQTSPNGASETIAPTPAILAPVTVGATLAVTVIIIIAALSYIRHRKTANNDGQSKVTAVFLST